MGSGSLMGLIGAMIAFMVAVFAIVFVVIVSGWRQRRRCESQLTAIHGFKKVGKRSLEATISGVRVKVDWFLGGRYSRSATVYTALAGDSVPPHVGLRARALGFQMPFRSSKPRTLHELMEVHGVPEDVLHPEELDDETRAMLRNLFTLKATFGNREAKLTVWRALSKPEQVAHTAQLLAALVRFVERRIDVAT